MNVKVSYLFMVLIWSTTPLGIVFSSETVAPTLAVLMRMLIGLVLAAFVVSIANVRIPWHRRACFLYGYSSIGIYGGMLLSYMAAKTVPSGLISLTFGLAPILSGLLAQRLLNEPKFSAIKLIALAFALIGLYLVSQRHIQGSLMQMQGLLYVLLAVCFFSLSGVMIKRVKIAIHPMATTFGALIFVTPLFFITWWLLDGELNSALWSAKSLWSIVYLGVFGSLIGALAYFHVLQKLAASTVALTTLITPSFAIALGAWLNNEPVDLQLIMGAVIILLSLAVFQFGEGWFSKRGKLKNKPLKS
ncbi:MULTISPECIES: DMT family transporter [unclassified Pseudoalteromonas]|uniref:DMT family transporter n=1 Tax=unclassified Pseudoalteromonas TaxID=194690 RepID=UPI0025B608B1|nr:MULTISPECIES: DMT family transporter [unclassified Pseudoalteromonas]MDN3377014.1 DMT family transporter [Pseudoalteromonas sp. APC 3893]MDN3388520.1 DMT family transporter [Pseudoalteromonas sp. APC 4017]